MLLDLPEGELLDGGDITVFCLHTMLFWFSFYKAQPK